MSRKKLRDSKTLQQQGLVDKAKQEQRDMTPEEKAQFDNLQKEIEALALLDTTGDGSNDEAEKAMENERKRATEITQLCREFGKNPEEFIKKGKSVDAVRETILSDIIENGAPISARGTDGLSITTADEDKFRAAAADALVMRGGVGIEKPAEGARDLMGMSLRDIAIETMQSAGEINLNRKSNDELYLMLSRDYYSPTSLFPSILDTAINKAYVEGHKNVPTTFESWVKKGTLKDFKTQDNNYLAGPAGEFLEVPEGGELKHDIPKDEKLPSRKLKTYGRQFTMARQAFINDDIGFLSTVPAKYAASAKRTQNEQVYKILIDNPAIYDGTALFSKAHGNTLASGTGITAESVQKMFMALQLQKDQFGKAIIIRPATIIVPIGYKFTIYTLFESPTINTTGNTQAVNPLYQFSKSINVVEDPTLNVLAAGGAMPWFIVGDKADTDSIQIDYLNGQEIPTIRRMETPGQLGFVWDIFLDWGITVMNYRGIIRNPGITIDNPLD